MILIVVINHVFLQLAAERLVNAAFVPSGSTDLDLVYPVDDITCEPYQLGLRLCTGRTTGLGTFEAKVRYHIFYFLVIKELCVVSIDL